MNTRAASYGTLSLFTLLVPSLASAQTLSTTVSLLNIFVGLMIVAAFLAFFGGFIAYLIRLGTWPTYRDEAIRYMEWGPAILFVLMVVLVIVRLFQYHPQAVTAILGLVIGVLVVVALLYALTAKEEKEEE